MQHAPNLIDRFTCYWVHEGAWLGVLQNFCFDRLRHSKKLPEKLEEMPPAAIFFRRLRLTLFSYRQFSIAEQKFILEMFIILVQIFIFRLDWKLFTISRSTKWI